jgi:predicted glycoside hydrolase/deacetylase ChbG (UPF0249 family)
MVARRQVVVHHDDLGASWSANVAFIELCERGVVSCGSVMVPCPWFPHMAQLARENPGLDIGVHLTLTAEFDRMRWRPMTGVADNGMCDAEGYFPRRVADTRRADPLAVERELRAQVDAALEAGIDVTHLDAHMGTVWLPEFVEIYERLGADYRLPIFLPGPEDSWVEPSAALDRARERAAARGNPRFDGVVSTPFGNLSPTAADYRGILDGAAAGLTWGAFHFTRPGDIAMISDDAPTRLAEYEIFTSGAAERIYAELELELVGMRGYRKRMRVG